MKNLLSVKARSRIAALRRAALSVCLALPLVLAIPGCGGGGSGPSTGGGTPMPTQPAETPIPPVGTPTPVPSGSNDFQFAPGTFVIKMGSPVQISSSNATSLVLNQPVDLPPDSVILSQVGSGTLVKVVSSQKVGTTTVVQTEPAALADAFTKLTLPDKMPFNEQLAGPLNSLSPDVKASWVADTSSTTKDVIRLDFGSTATNATALRAKPRATFKGIGVRGTVDFKINPVFNPVIETGSDGKGVLKSLELGFKPEFHGTLELQQINSGSFSIDSKPYVDKDLNSFMVGPVVVTPHLNIHSAVTGEANYAFGAGVRCDSSTTAVLKFQNGSVTPVTLGASDTKAEITAAKGTFDFDARLVEATVTFKVFGVGGPSIGAFVGSTADGKLIANASGEDVIEANADSGLYVTVGLKGSEVVKKFFEGIFKFLNAGELPSIEHKFQILGPHFEAKFLVKSDILVGDNGTAADDVFQVTVDGRAAGSTLKGGDGKFPISDLSPGNHSLQITCTDVGAPDDDIGTLGVSLSDGLTFADGSTTYTADMSLGQTLDLTVVVPKNPQVSIKAAMLKRVTSGRRGR